MSRSAPDTKVQNPAVHFFEWAGADDGGYCSYYSKSVNNPKTGKPGANVKVPLPFTFLVLDELATVKGWDDANDCGIYSNEVRDTRSEVMVVKSHKGGIIASGLYADVRDKVLARGGWYATNIYIGFREDGKLKIGGLQFKGAALNAWVEFRKAVGGKLWEQAVGIVGFNEGTKGKITFRTPKFALKEVSPQTNEDAKALDVELQAFLKDYFARTKTVQAEAPPAKTEHSEPEQKAPDERPDDFEPQPEAPVESDDVPF